MCAAAVPRSVWSTAAVVDVFGLERFAALANQERHDSEHGHRIGPAPSERGIRSKAGQDHGRS